MKGTIVPSHAGAQERQDYGEEQKIRPGLKEPKFQLHKALSIAEGLFYVYSDDDCIFVIAAWSKKVDWSRCSNLPYRLYLGAGYDFFLLNPRIYIISRIARVLKMKMQINHTRCLLPAARHRATPFQGRVHRASRRMTNVIQSGVRHEFTGSILSSPFIGGLESAYYRSVPVSECWLFIVHDECFQLIDAVLELALGHEVIGRDIPVLYSL